MPVKKKKQQQKKLAKSNQQQANQKVAAKAINFGLIAILLFFGVFGILAATLPINSSSIAIGKIVLDFNKKTIQHFEGGIIAEIMVKEGEFVHQGEDLVILQNIQAKAQKSLVQKQLLSAKSIYNRLVLEQTYEQELDLNSIREQAINLNFNEIDEIIQTQTNIYKIKQEAYLGKIDILKQRIMQTEKEIEGLNYQYESQKTQLEILAQELEFTQKMVELKNLPMSEELALSKEIANLKGQKGSLTAAIAKAKQSISEINLEIINFTKEHLNNILAEMQEIENEIAGLSEQLISTTDILTRTIIKAPVSGLVMDLKYHTKGAVIPPAGEIMNIVPQNDDLIIEARVKPVDIDLVKQGLKAKISLSAFKAKKVPKLDGEILTVSADIMIDEATGENYFLARIAISTDSLANLNEKIELYPGMPAETYIITGSRTILAYLIAPIKDASYKAFRDD